MLDWMILTAVHLLKGAILGGLALISWGVQTMTAPECAGVVAVVGCRSEGTAGAPHTVALRIDTKVTSPWVRLGTLVPPIRVETLYTPDVLHPALVTAPAPSIDQAT